MRHFRSVLILAVLFLLPGFGQAGWFWQNPKPTGNTLRSVCFIDTTIGYTVGDLGTLLKTTDGGVSWIDRNRGTTTSFTGVCFPGDAQTGYAEGSGGSGKGHNGRDEG
jgi:hypothetical protein